MRRCWPLVLLGALGCDSGEGPGETSLLLPDLAGEWSGTFSGEIGLIGAPGATVRDTFQLAFDVQQDEALYVYDGEVLRGGAGPEYLYGYRSGTFAVSEDRRAQIECVQSTQLGEALVLRVRGAFDPSFAAFEGVVHDAVGVEGEEYAVILRRSAP
jgi:hypothetical protein